MSLEESTFVFVNVSEEASAAERKRNTRFARAHAAKINRRKHKAKTVKDPTGPAHDNVRLLLDQQSLPSGLTAPAIPDREPPKIVDVLEDQPQTKQQREDNPVTENLAPAVPIVSSDSTSHESSQNGRNIPSAEIARFFSPSGPLVPIGALRIETFDWDASTVSTKIAKHLLHVTWPVMAGKEATSQWFHEFCTSPLVFDVAHITAASHWDVAAGEFIWSEDKEVVSRKQSVIERVRQRLDNVDALDQQEVETLIFAIVTLARHDFQKEHLHTTELLLFTPHFPNLQWIPVYGRLSFNGAPARAIAHLVDRLGGLKALYMQSLAAQLARTYLHECAMEFRKPYYACYWDSQLHKLVDDLSLYTTAKSAGEGFVVVADLLSKKSLPVFRELSILDRIMAQYRHLETSSQEMMEILSTRNAGVHALLSLPEWEDLDPVERKKTHRTVYDVCRLTCAIYVNAVIIGFPPHSKWHIRLCGRLRWLHESTLTRWPVVASEVLLWSLTVGSIAAFVSPHREFFELALQRAIFAADISKWSQVHHVLRKFVWDAHACQQGVAMLRERLGDTIDWG